MSYLLRYQQSLRLRFHHILLEMVAKAQTVDRIFRCQRTFRVLPSFNDIECQ